MRKKRNNKRQEERCARPARRSFLRQSANAASKRKWNKQRLNRGYETYKWEIAGSSMDKLTIKENVKSFCIVTITSFQTAAFVV
jgi:hypothetical protein